MLNHKAQFHFFETLNVFLPTERRARLFTYHFKGIASVKNLIEALGIPHTEIALIIVNGKKAAFHYSVKDDDQILVYPYNYPRYFGLSFIINKITALIRNRNIKFVVDVNLGKLAKYLRICGFDVVFDWEWDDNRIIDHGVEEKRVILTRDIGLLKNKKVKLGYWVRSQDPEVQIVEVIKRYHLLSCITPFKRCLHCNNLLRPIAKKSVKDRVESMIYDKYHRFYRCDACQKIYWKGPHYDNMKNLIRTIKRNGRLFLIRRQR